MNKPVLLDFYHLIFTPLGNIIISFLYIRKLKHRLMNLPKVIHTSFYAQIPQIQSYFDHWINQGTVRK